MKTEYKKRVVDSILEFDLECMGAVLIEGPKWCGKTTTAIQKSKSILDLQDPDNKEMYLDTANKKPSLLLIGENPRLIDEWQDAPILWDAIRKDIDKRGEDGLYILTGSTSKNVKTAHTGTGRISTLKMYPMSLYESGDSTGDVSITDMLNGKVICKYIRKVELIEIAKYIIRGGWPENIKRDICVFSI